MVAITDATGDLTANNILLVDADEGDSRIFSAKVRMFISTGRQVNDDRS